MNLDEPLERSKFRKNLREMGVEEVRYRLASKKFSSKKSVVAEAWLRDQGTSAEYLDSLEEIVEFMTELKGRFVKGGNLTGYFLQIEDDAAFEAKYLELKILLEECFGKNNPFSSKVHSIHLSGHQGMTPGISLAAVIELLAIFPVVQKAMFRPKKKAPQLLEHQDNLSSYVNAERMAQILELGSSIWDFQRLHRMCEELNSAFANSCFISVAALLRAVLDHVPPVFGKENFSSVANSVATKSNKELMLRLDETTRKIGNKWLHTQIQKVENLPNSTQVDARQALDVLLAEVIRYAKLEPMKS